VELSSRLSGRGDRLSQRLRCIGQREDTIVAVEQAIALQHGNKLKQPTALLHRGSRTKEQLCCLLQRERVALDEEPQ